MKLLMLHLQRIKYTAKQLPGAKVCAGELLCCIICLYFIFSSNLK